jgi:thiol-disulfide isomerase/thioredoxin
MNKNLLRRRQLLAGFGLGVLGAGAAAIAFPRSTKDTVSAATITKTNPSEGLITVAPSGNTLPEFQGISTWLNSNPLTIAGLRGNVVLIQFWTFACINCQRTLPSVIQWHRQYAAQGLKVIGIHTPELAFERDINNVRRALQEHGITYPVPIDGDFQTWRAYGNSYWPHLYLADRQGVMRYDHVGEGAYDQTEQTIRQLLG